jgi:CRP-like cAMP-binding protein
MNQQSLVETLRGIHFLEGTSEEHLEQIAGVAEIRDYEVGDFVFNEGDEADKVYLIVYGQLVLEVCTPEWGCKQIVTVGPGEMLGWSSLSHHRRTAATARVIEKARLARINSARLLAICDEDPVFGYEFMHKALLALAKRITVTWAQLSRVHVNHFLPTTTSSGER